MGFAFFDPDDVEGVAAFIERPEPMLLDHNRRLAAEHFSVSRMRAALGALLDEAGWRP